MRRALLLSLLVATAGCHRYTPIPMGQVEPEMTVRARLADRPTSPPVEGAVMQLVDGRAGFMLQPEFRPGESGEPVRVLETNLASLERRELDGTRTGLLIAGTILAGVGTMLLIDGNPFSEGPRPGGGEVFIRLPLLGH